MEPVKVHNGHGRPGVCVGGEVSYPTPSIEQRFALNRDCIGEVRDCFPAMGNSCRWRQCVYRWDVNYWHSHTGCCFIIVALKLRRIFTTWSLAFKHNPSAYHWSVVRCLDCRGICLIRFWGFENKPYAYRWNVVQYHSYTASCYVIVTSDMPERYFDSVLSFLEIDDLYICDISSFVNPIECVLSWLQLLKMCQGTSRYWTSWNLCGIRIMVVWFKH